MIIGQLVLIGFGQKLIFIFSRSRLKDSGHSENIGSFIFVGHLLAFVQTLHRTDQHYYYKYHQRKAFLERPRGDLECVCSAQHVILACLHTKLVYCRSICTFVLVFFYISLHLCLVHLLRYLSKKTLSFFSNLNISYV